MTPHSAPAPLFYHIGFFVLKGLREGEKNGHGEKDYV